MTSDKDLKLICSVAVVLFLVGVLCYAAVPAKAPEDPIRIQYRSDLGNVTFQHSKHVASYGASCYDCHHHPGNDDIGLVACSVCHLKDAESPRRLPAVPRRRGLLRRLASSGTDGRRPRAVQSLPCGFRRRSARLFGMSF